MREEYLDAGGSRKDKKREKSGKFRYFTRLINILFLISHFQGYQQNLKGALVLVFLYHTMSLCLFSFSLPTFGGIMHISWIYASFSWKLYLENE